MKHPPSSNKSRHGRLDGAIHDHPFAMGALVRHAVRRQGGEMVFIDGRYEPAMTVLVWKGVRWTKARPIAI
jgi:hypothetical protein